MSEEKTEIALVSLPSVPAELEQAFINDEFVDSLINKIREEASAVVGDLNKAAGRKVYISMAAKVRSTKVMIDDAGKDLVAEMKKRPALVDASRRKVREALDELAVKVRKPVTDWEADQERIKAEHQMQAWHAEALEMNENFDLQRAIQFEADHELALLMNEKHDRDVVEAKAEAERQRTAHEEELKRQAAEQAKRDADAEIAAAAKREADARAALEKAEQDAKDAAAQAEQQRIEEAAQAERDKQTAIEAEQLRAKQEADRIRLEAEQKEQARLAEEKRIADEAAERAANVEHRRSVNRSVVAGLITAGVPEDCAKKCVEAVARMQVQHMTINY
ncbi:hypothetical protein [Serratia liquefaciens]|uniref:hypothetical protein n=1 Tax=Serratia liquefaciens TaxID=614 RepID=UPI00217C7404|nr:hypothetical protein [Serratia liquefaciens]CAI1905538.1 Uncharacterised protein [Serratia liquefaciens]